MALLHEPSGGRIGMREVAERSGASLATIYRRWPSRTELLLDAIQHFVEQDAPVPDTGDLRTDLLTVLNTIRRRRDAFMEGLPRIWIESAASPELRDALRDRQLGLGIRALHVVLQQARSHGRLPAEVDLRLVADTAMALFARRAMLYGRPPTRTYLTRIVDHALLPMLGLGIPKPSPKRPRAGNRASTAPDREKTSR